MTAKKKEDARNEKKNALFLYLLEIFFKKISKTGVLKNNLKQQKILIWRQTNAPVFVLQFSLRTKKLRFFFYQRFRNVPMGCLDFHISSVAICITHTHCVLCCVHLFVKHKLEHNSPPPKDP